MRGRGGVSHKFFSAGRMTRTPVEQLYKEAAFIAYYFHWQQDEILLMPHRVRRRWCAGISEINAELSSEEKKENVFEIR